METIIGLVSSHLRDGNEAPAQRFLTPDGWVGRSYGELWTLVQQTAQKLRECGAGEGGPIAIVAQTRPEWSVVDLAAALIGAALVPVYPTASQAQFDDIQRRTRPAIVVTDRDDLASEARQLRLGGAHGDLGALSRPVLSASERDALATVAAGVRADHVYSIVFSSGSTGTPKGCVLTHANFVAVLRMAAEVESAGPEGAAHRAHAFVYLPLAHVSARLQQLTTFTLGGELAYGSGGTPELLAQIGELQPTYVPGVPRLFESAYLRVGRSGPRLREVFGPRLRYALSGGAPIDPEVMAAYESAGITLVEGYGLTETAAALALSTPGRRRAGSVGPALPGVELRIAEDGEILARGANVFAGYLDDPDGTAEVIEGGWLRTGDLGRLDDDGFLFVTGRKKNLLITSTGKNVAPEPIENQLRLALGIADVMIAGEARPYLVAALFTSDAVDASVLIEAAQRVNAGYSPPERVRKLVVVPTGLHAARGELTASGKIVRHAVTARFADVLDAVYDGRPAGVEVLDVHAPSTVPVFS